MKTAAIIASLTVVGSLAFAAGKGDSPQPSLPVSERPDAAGRTPVAAAAATCQTTAGESWFSPVFHPITFNSGCAGFFSNGQAFNFADVNGDGLMDYFAYINGQCIGKGVPYSGCLLARSTMSEQGNQTVAEFTCVMDAALMAESILQRYPQTTYAVWNPGGWRDMDSDGDLDLVVIVDIEAGSATRLDGWFENIGYEKPTPPLAADLNRDGSVDGVDLGILLAAWGT